MPMNAPQFQHVDLNSCDREPIHIPGAIQPHGVLLVVRRHSLAIEHFAGDTQLLLGVEPDRLPQYTLADLFVAPTLQLLTERLARADTKPTFLHNLSAREGSLLLDASVHAQGELGIVELEIAGRSSTADVDVFAHVKAMLAVMQAANDAEACCHAMATQVRAVTGFDRVMVYQFLHDSSGKVVAEDKAERLQSFLGLHYPASDIPTQARALYRSNWLRLIPDVNYTPAPLIATLPHSSHDPVDMSQCFLRSVSPLHLEYLRNMGVSATLTLSIIIGNDLWGLIACHHHSPRRLASELRLACELLAQIFSLQLHEKIEFKSAQRRLVPAHIQEALTRRLLSNGDIVAALGGPNADLLELISASGAAVLIDGKMSTVGETPPAGFIAALVAWLHEQDQPIVDIYELSAVFPPAAAWTGIASGLLAISLSRSAPDYVL